MTRASAQEVPDAPSDDRRRAGTISELAASVWPAMLIASVVATAIMLYVHSDGWRGGFFFDEEWRADIIRSSDPIDRLLLNDAPNPVGWLYAMKVPAALIGYHPFGYRVLSAALFVLALGIVGVLLARMLQRRGGSWDRLGGAATGRPARSMTPAVIGGLAAGLVALVAPINHTAQFFNNYTFELAYVALGLLAVEELGRTRGAFIASCVLIALSPLMLFGGLMAIPALAIATVAWVIGDDTSRRSARLIGLAGAGAFAAVSGLAAWVTVYGPIGSKPSIGEFWIERGASLGGSDGLTTLLGRTAEQFGRGLTGPRLATDDPAALLGVELAAALLLVVGCIVAWRAWPWLVVMVGSAWVLSIGASAVVQWPMTIERVNLAFTALAFALAMLGLVWGIAWLLGGRALPALAALGLFAFAVWPNIWPFHPEVFARRLGDDARSIVVDPDGRTIVLAYHPLSHWYVHDTLINDQGADIELLFETPEDPGRLYSGLDATIDELALSSGDTVWCVLPYGLADRTQDACLLDEASFTLESSVHGGDAEIRGHRVN